MTIEQLAELTADKLAALSTEELDKILRPYYQVTRPELAPKPNVNGKQVYEPMPYMTPGKKAAFEAMKAEGMDLSFLRRKKK